MKLKSLLYDDISALFRSSVVFAIVYTLFEWYVSENVVYWSTPIYAFFGFLLVVGVCDLIGNIHRDNKSSYNNSEETKKVIREFIRQRNYFNESGKERDYMTEGMIYGVAYGYKMIINLTNESDRLEIIKSLDIIMEQNNVYKNK